jgi:hypothetical protein
MNEQLGIDKIKLALQAGMNINKRISKAKADDGKVSVGEAIGISVTSLPDLYKTIKNGKQIKEQWLDMDDNERQELKQWFASGFDIENDKAEKKIEAIFNWIAVTSETIIVVAS